MILTGSGTRPEKLSPYRWVQVVAAKHELPLMQLSGGFVPAAGKEMGRTEAP